MNNVAQSTGVLHVIHVPGDSRLFVAELYRTEADERCFYRIVEGGRYADIVCTQADMHVDLTVRIQNSGSDEARRALFVECAAHNTPLYSGLRRAGVSVPIVVELPYREPLPHPVQKRPRYDRGVALRAVQRNSCLR